LNLGDLERGQGSGAFKTVDCMSTKVQEVNQVKLRVYYSNKGRLYTVDRGKSMYSNKAGAGAHQYKKQKRKKCERAWQPERVSRSDKVRKLVHPQEKGKQGGRCDI
jgi:hypothetical protein